MDRNLGSRSEVVRLTLFGRLVFAYRMFVKVLSRGGAVDARGSAQLPPPVGLASGGGAAEGVAAECRSELDSAMRLLALLQREGRLVDFLQEDVAHFSDAEVGAAARLVHSGCRKAMREHLSLVPIRSEAEGSRVEVPPVFDVSSLRLTGSVVGPGPYLGILRHSGWRVVKISLPHTVGFHDVQVLAQAEVEL